MSIQLLEKILEEGIVATETISEKLSEDLNEEQMVALGFFNGLIEKTSTFNHLYSNNYFVTLDSITRPIMENYIYLKYILSKDNQKKNSFVASRSYIFEFRMEQINIHLDRIAKNKMGKKIRKLFPSLSLQRLEEMYSEKEAYQDQIDLKEKFDDILYLRNQKDKWYDINQNKKKITSFEQLCFYMGFEAEYEHFYRPFSKEIHSSNAIEIFDYSAEEFDETLYLKANISLILVIRFIQDIIVSYYEWNSLKGSADNFKEMIEETIASDYFQINVEYF